MTTSLFKEHVGELINTKKLLRYLSPDARLVLVSSVNYVVEVVATGQTTIPQTKDGFVRVHSFLQESMEDELLTFLYAGETNCGTCVGKIYHYVFLSPTVGCLCMETHTRYNMGKYVISQLAF